MNTRKMLALGLAGVMAASVAVPVAALVYCLFFHLSLSFDRFKTADLLPSGCRRRYSLVPEDPEQLPGPIAEALRWEWAVRTAGPSPSGRPLSAGACTSAAVAAAAGRPAPP